MVWLAGSMLSVTCIVSAREMWLDVPFVRQSRDGCGSACISMILKYWDANTHQRTPRDSEAEIYRKLHSPDTHGIPALAMDQYFRTQGFRAIVFSGTWQDLQEQLSKGRPVIVCLRNGPAHYLVVAGIDMKQGIILVNDPARRKLLKLKRIEFEKGWTGSSNWTLLALP
jgi:ABC-type bacteriocin/lantibiotic exporter with double-glycine peptidase domain